MGNRTWKERENMSLAIRDCVPKPGEKAKTQSEIWELARQRGILGSKHTFLKRFHDLEKYGWIKGSGPARRGRLYKRYALETDEISNLLSSDRYIRERINPTMLFQRMRASYTHFLLELVNVKSSRELDNKLDLYLTLYVNPQLRRYAESFWELRDRFSALTP